MSPAASEMENELKCQHLTVVIGMQVNFGLEISIYKYIFASFGLISKLN